MVASSASRKGKKKEGRPKTVAPRAGSKKDMPQTGRWTNEEHVLFLKGIEMHERNWKQIQSVVKTRSLIQIRSHAQKYFLKVVQLKQRGLLKGDKLMMDGQRMLFAPPPKDQNKRKRVTFPPPRSSKSKSDSCSSSSTSSSAATTPSPSASSSPRSVTTTTVTRAPQTSLSDVASRLGQRKRAFTRSVARSLSQADGDATTGEGVEEEEGATEKQELIESDSDNESDASVSSSSSSSSTTTVASSRRGAPTRKTTGLRSRDSSSSRSPPFSAGGSMDNDGNDDGGMSEGDVPPKNMITLSDLTMYDLEMLMKDMYADEDCVAVEGGIQSPLALVARTEDGEEDEDEKVGGGTTDRGASVAEHGHAEEEGDDKEVGEEEKGGVDYVDCKVAHTQGRVLIQTSLPQPPPQLFTIDPWVPSPPVISSSSSLSSSSVSIESERGHAAGARASTYTLTPPLTASSEVAWVEAAQAPFMCAAPEQFCMNVTAQQQQEQEHVEATTTDALPSLPQPLPAWTPFNYPFTSCAPVMAETVYRSSTFAPTTVSFYTPSFGVASEANPILADDAYGVM